MKFPKIKRANFDFNFYSPSDVKKERLSRAKWAKIIALKINAIAYLTKDIDGVKAHKIMIELLDELDRQAKLDEK